MNTKYETGNVIRSSVDFSNFKFPNELPTEEWAGNEARSYTNYIRPVANLFENDRELKAFSNDILVGMLKSGKNGVVTGCEVAGNNTAPYYFEVKQGVFVYNGKVYHIYPQCEALAKQIESEVEIKNLGDLDLKITYNEEKYFYNYTWTHLKTVDDTTAIVTDTDSGSTNTNSALELINTLLGIFGITGTNIEDYIILPILKVDNLTNNIYIYFNGSNLSIHIENLEEELPVGALTIAEIEVGDDQSLTDYTIIYPDKFNYFDGERISNSTIKNDSLVNKTVTVGSTPISLGSAESTFTGITSINSISLNTATNDGITITDGTNEINFKGSYALKNACTKEYTTDINIGANEPIPTSSAVKNYVEGGNYSVANTVTHQSQLKVTDITDASRTDGSVSGDASIYTAGGIEAKGNIYSDGSVVGTGAGTYSHSSLKENIYPFVESAVDLINHVLIVNFNYKADEDKNHKIGFLADYTHEYFSTKEKNMMDIPNCIGLLLKAVQELSAENKELKERLDEISSTQHR